jgi:hypothetical protein
VTGGGSRRPRGVARSGGEAIRARRAALRVAAGGRRRRDARDLLGAARGLTVTPARAELTAAEGAPAHDLTVWLTGIAAPFRVALPAAETRRVLALWGGKARTGEAELRVGD